MREELRRLLSHEWSSLLIAAAGGALWAGCFGRQALTVAPVLALVPIFLLLGTPRPALAGFVHGLVFWAVSMSWIRPTLETYGGLAPWLSAPAMVLLASYLGSYTAIFGWIGSRLWSRSVPVVLVALPALWVTLETLRGWMLGGFPWNLAGYAAAEIPGALATASLVGVYGISFLVLMVNAALALGLSRRSFRIPIVTALIVGGLLQWAATDGGGSPEQPESPTVKLVQPNTEILTVWEEASARRNYSRLMEFSRRACQSGPALLVWPESASWPLSFERHESLRRDVVELARRGCPVIVNSPARRGDEVFNSVYLVTGGAEAARYDKRHLVPFGEYVPWWSRLPFVGTIARRVGNFTPGAEDRLLEWEGELLGMAICFEVIFPEETARRVAAGATVLVTVTNDGWYGDSTAPWQHFRMARFRAAENRRPLLRAALTGVSGVVSADGSVAQQLGVGKEGILETTLRGNRERTFYNRAPWVVPVLSWIVAAFAIFRGSRARRS